MKVSEYLKELITKLEARVEKQEERIQKLEKGNIPTTIILGVIILIAGIGDKLPWDQILGAIVK